MNTNSPCSQAVCLLSAVLLAASAAHSEPRVTLRGNRTLENNFPLGSWGRAVKNSTMDSPWHDNAEDTAAALQGLNQNFFIYSIASEEEKTDFEELLTTTKGTDVQLYASVGSWTTACGGDRFWDNRAAEVSTEWGVSLTTCKCDSYPDYPSKSACAEAWVRAWEDHALYASDLASRNDHLVGFVINDFGGLIEGPDRPQCAFGTALTSSQLGRVQTAVHTFDSGFRFMPAFSFSEFGRKVAPGYILGANYGVNLHPNYSYPAEDMIVTLKFDLSVEPTSALLSFFHDDGINGLEALNIYKQVYVNGSSTPVMDESMYDDKSYQHFQSSIDGLMPGENEIQLVVHPAVKWNGCGKPFWYVWDVRLEVTGTVPDSSFPTPVRLFLDDDDFTASYSTVPRSDKTYTVNKNCGGETAPAGSTISNAEPRCVCGAAGTSCLIDDPNTGLIAQRLVASSNALYRVDGLIDGVVAVHTATEMLPGYGYSPDSYSALLESTKRILGDSKTLMTMHWAWLENFYIDLGNLAEQLEIDASLADAAGVWNYPNEMYFMEEQKGIFAEHMVDAGSDYTFMAYWPGRQSHLDGWYQCWVSNPKLAGKTIRVTLKDSEAASTAGPLIKSVFKTPWFWSLFETPPVSGTPWFSEDACADGTEPTTIELTVPADERVVLWAETQGDIGSSKVEFLVVDANDASIVYGADYFEFDSGVTSQVVLDTYETVRDTFRRIRTRMMP